jgi:GAF domain-containing protein
MRRLHELSTRLLGTTELQPLLEEVLDATMALQNAHFGNVQLYDPAAEALQIVASRGFGPEFLAYFASVRDAATVCGRALLRRERVIVDDVEADAAFAPHRAIAARSGFRAVQSTPLVGRAGALLGMISTYFRQPHRPSERDLRFTDLYAQHAAGLIERERAEDALRASEERFRR